MTTITTSSITMSTTIDGPITRSIVGGFFQRVKYHWYAGLRSEAYAQLKGAWCAITMCDRTIAHQRLGRAKAVAKLAGLDLEVKAIGDAQRLLDQVKMAEAKAEVERIHAALELRMRIQ